MLNDLPLGPLERALVDSLQRLDPQASPVVLASAALLCMALAPPAGTPKYTG